MDAFELQLDNLCKSYPLPQPRCALAGATGQPHSKFIYKLLALSLAIACFSGCSAANTEIASSSAAAATVDPAANSTEVPASNNVFTSAGDGLYVTTDSGIYELQ